MVGAWREGGSLAQILDGLKSEDGDIYVAIERLKLRICS